MIEEQSNLSKSLSTKKRYGYIKIYPQSVKYFGQKGGVLFGILSELGKKYPNGFVKYISPCPNSPLYKKGQSLCELWDVSKSTVMRSLDKMRTSYKSKPSYLKALEELGEDGVFQGMPFLCYQDKETDITWYCCNQKIIQEIIDGTWKPSNLSPEKGE